MVLAFILLILFSKVCSSSQNIFFYIVDIILKIVFIPQNLNLKLKIKRLIKQFFFFKIDFFVCLTF